LPPDITAFRLGMNFRDSENLNVGKGFRGSDIYRSIDDNQKLVSISPNPYSAESEISIFFNAAKGNGELIGAEKVYIHSSVGIIETSTPENNAWNKVIGNWGEDDGLGEMTKVSESGEMWKITLTPVDYYKLAEGDHPFWLAAVFRNADGSKKASAGPDSPFNGFVSENGDFFIRNAALTTTGEVEELPYIVYPNPTFGPLYVKGFQGEMDFRLYDTAGKLLWFDKLKKTKLVDLSTLRNGLYFYTIQTREGIKTGSLVVFR
jgi:hypothetical protein